MLSILYNHTPRATKLLGGYIGFTPSVRRSVCQSAHLSRILHPPCSTYSFGLIKEGDQGGWHWHILSIPLTTVQGTGAETYGCFLLTTFVPVQKLCVNICIYAFSIWVLLKDVYIYIQQEFHSVLVKLHPITSYRTVFRGSAQFLGWMPLLFSLVYQLCLALWW